MTFPRGLSAISEEWVVTAWKLVRMEATFQVEGSQHIQVSRQEAAWKDRQLPRGWFQAEVELNETAQAGGHVKDLGVYRKRNGRLCFACHSFIEFIHLTQIFAKSTRCPGFALFWRLQKWTRQNASLFTHMSLCDLCMTFNLDGTQFLHL